MKLCVNRSLPLLVGIALALVTTVGADPALPIRNVVMFSSGVGYFQRSGRVDGTATIPLQFRIDQVNDILKSLVILDPAGNVKPVTYTTKDSLGQRLQAVGLQLDGEETLGSVLRHFQGARVRVFMGAETIEGRILSVSIKTIKIPGKEDSVTQQEVLNLMTEGGLRAVPLDQVTQIKLLDERLDAQLRESLALLAGGLDDQKRTVELHFGGNAAREVRAGYLQEMPVWKTSYRLVLDAKQKPFLQGWANVENTTDEDWNEVRLSLVSGRPISFIQDLYQPLYIPRPVVAPQVIGSPNPQTYGEALNESAAPEAPPTNAPKPSTVLGRQRKTDRAADMGGAARGPMGPAGIVEGLADSVNGLMVNGPTSDQLARNVAQAQGAERGELFEYAIRQPVTLPKQQAAMVPIIGDTIEGEAVSIYDPDSDATHALNGFRLKNNTGLHLSGGPITVFRDGTYAGDGQINNVQPDETRLISYAVDLDLVVDRKGPNYDQQTVSLSEKNGVLVISRKQRNARLYTFRNKSDRAKSVIVQQTIEPAFNLVEPKEPYEKTPTAYRFKVEVPAKKTVEYHVTTERPLSETVALLDMDINALISYTKNAQASDKLKAALGQVVVLRRKVIDLQTQRSVAENELNAINQEQSRIRQNMGQLDRNSTLYQQYVKKLTDQETRVDQLQTEITRLRAAEVEAQKELRAYVDTVTVE